MMTPARYVCIHGHFYQPPRENPWLDTIEQEKSAAPYHDWNERINIECYRANAAARLVDDKNRILSLRNNYRSLSFNFGPTLFRWLQKHDPWSYNAILEADQESMERFGGHGNAMAQVYNHIIMPLANTRDKITQVHWGIRDFEWRFGHRPEGMWLAETAVDRETLRTLADAGIKFTILSPFQAARWRFRQPDAAWQEVRHGDIPTGRAYRYDCGDGKFIHLFFYDANLARGIAFERVLEHSSKFVSQIDASYEQRDHSRFEPWLVHTATDGESYGHHFKFGDMALAATLEALDRAPHTRTINYGAFLAAFPAQADVEILENTAWSCAHGVGRWASDCGCHIAGDPGWNQKWRAPLREALNNLRDSLAPHYERAMKHFTKDPWKVRDAYIEVLLDRENRMADFARRHIRRGSQAEGAHRFFQLLEMQRYSMYMFTSCGWFFDEVSNLESILILRYAAYAIQLAEKTGLTGIEPPFLETLAKAPSNVPEYGNGADVYLRRAKPEAVSHDRVAANYAIQSLATLSHRRYHIYTYELTPHKEEDLGPNPAPCLYGHTSVKDDRTQEESEYLFAALHFGGFDFRCSVKPYAGPEEYDRILKTLQSAVEEQNTVKMIRTLDESFGTSSFSLHDVFQDMRSSTALRISQRAVSTYTDFQRHLFQTYRPIMASLHQWDIQIPEDLLVAVKRVLSDEATQLVRDVLQHEQRAVMGGESWDRTDFYTRAHMARLHSLLEDARTWGVDLQLSEAGVHLGKALVDALGTLKQTFAPQDARHVYRIVSLCRALNVKSHVWRSQTLYFEFVETGRRKPELMTRLKNIRGFMEELDEFLDCRFSRFFGELTTPSPRDVVPVA